MDIAAWWDSLSSLQKIHWGIALPATIIFVIQLIITLTTGATDMDTSVDHDGNFSRDHGDGIHIQLKKLMKLKQKKLLILPKKKLS